MRRTHGFTLIETLISAFILTVGILAAVTLFSYSSSTNLHNRQRTAAAVLLYDKMEEFKSSPLPGSGSDIVTLNGTAYLRVWEITDSTPRAVTVVIYADAGNTHRRTELIRASTMIGKSF